ncbi:YqzL family protein [Lentibacillus salicampi]|uniref:YqzL family protein n=1 Tax=Lentibacillus salicampi TaxID=175306 RepID=A0A4Y9AE46_9BACI|nr:YqzL family protein [Lentibacillus salicampi]TFJ94086.1 YqzL family protein [Lentibacillus salicampi]
MIDFTWKLFSQTGNIETYLLLKELEKNETVVQTEDHQKGQKTSLNTKS